MQVRKLELISPYKTGTLKRMTWGGGDTTICFSRMLDFSWPMGEKKSPLRMCDYAFKVWGFIFTIHQVQRPLSWKIKIKIGLGLVTSPWHLARVNPKIHWRATASFWSPGVFTEKVLLKIEPHATKLEMRLVDKENNQCRARRISDDRAVWKRLQSKCA